MWNTLTAGLQLVQQRLDHVMEDVAGQHAGKVWLGSKRAGSNCSVWLGEVINLIVFVFLFFFGGEGRRGRERLDLHITHSI